MAGEELQAVTPGAAELARHASVPLPERPLLVPWVEPVEMGDGLLELRAAETFYPLRHPILAAAFRAVEDRLAGDRSVDEIASDLPGDITAATVLFLLKTLCATGLLLDGAEMERDDRSASERLVFYSHFTDRPAAVERRLAAATVQVLGSTTLAGCVAKSLRTVGCGQVARSRDAVLDDSADLVVACADSPARRLYAAVNSTALERGVPWLRVACHGSLAWLGPLVLPGETACFACLEARERANARGSAVLVDFKADAIGSFPPLRELLAAQAAAEAARFLAGFAPPASVGNVYELSATSPDARRHGLLRDPACTACGGRWGDPPADAP